MKFIIYSPRYDENSGGIIALFKLGALLNQLGYACKVWTWDRVHPNEASFSNGKYRTTFVVPNDLKEDVGVNPFRLEPASADDIDDAIVVYPEIIEGNPLGAKRIVRWLLNKPGKITGKVLYSPNELQIHYSAHFLPDKTQANEARRVYIRHFPFETYFQENYGLRRGTCYMVRKGQISDPPIHPPDSIRLDGLPHQLIAKIFNTCEEFISYDIHTAYLLFASVCGCRAIAAPEKGVSIEAWKAPSAIAERNGIAYGIEDVPRAIATRQDMLRSIENIERENITNTERFIRAVEKRFHGSPVTTNFQVMPAGRQFNISAE